MTEVATARTGQAPAGPVPAHLRGALLRYRVLAYTVGVGLVVLTFIGVPLQIFAHDQVVATVVGIAHGYLYMVYAVLVFDLGRRARWTIRRTAAVVLAGTVPLLSFVAERWVTRRIHEEQ